MLVKYLESKEQTNLTAEGAPWSMKDLNSDLRKSLFSLKRNKREAISRTA